MIGQPCKKCGKPIEDDKKSTFCVECRKKIGRAAKHKGYSDEKRFERWFQAQLDLYQLPYKIMRTPSSGAIHNFDAADFFFKFLPQDSWFNRFHLEKKDRENWSLVEWVEEAEEKEKDTGLLRKPIVIVRKPNSSEDYIFMRSGPFWDLFLQLEKLTQELNK